MRKDWKNTFNVIKEIINDWELIPGAPQDEYDDLVFGILSRLNNEYSEYNLEKYTLDYLNDDLGLEVKIEKLKIKLKEIKTKVSTL